MSSGRPVGRWNGGAGGRGQPQPQGSVPLLLTALARVVALQAAGLNAAVLCAFAPDLALVVAAVAALCGLPAVLRTRAEAHHLFARQGAPGRT